MDRTVISPPSPRFKINQTVYSRASVIRGYLEPLRVVGVEYLPSLRQYIYTWSYEVGSIQLAYKVSPVKVPELQLLTLVEALPIQINVLERQLKELEEKQKAICAVPTPLVPVEMPEEVHGMISVPRPKYGCNQVVYLRESAETTGNLEAYRINNFKWEPSMMIWIYEMYIDRRPERAKTVGDDAELTRDSRLSYIETDLCSVCEALAAAITFMTNAVNRAKFRYNQLTGSTTG